LRAMSSSLWSSACSSAVDTPLQLLLDKLYASCGVTVRERAGVTGAKVGRCV